MSRQDQVFFILILSILFLLFFVIFLGFTTFYLRIKNHLRFKKFSQLEKVWEPILLDILSEDRSPEDVQAYVNQDSMWQFLSYLSRFIAVVDGDARKQLIDAGSPYIKHVVRKLRSWKIEKRAEVISLMNRLDPEKYDNEFRKALNDSSFLVNMVAAKALARKGQTENGEAILDNLDRFHIWSVNLLSSVIAQVGISLAPALRNLMLNRNKPVWQRVIAIETLIKLYDFKSGDYCEDICSEGENREVIAAYLRLMRLIADERHASAMRKLCERDDPVILSNAVRVLTQISTEENETCYKKAMDNPSIWVVINVAWGLKESGKLDILRKYAYSDHPRAGLTRQILTEV
jgi:hypothetical protein